MPSELRFYYGTMGSGKSTLALQIAHNLRQAGKNVVLLTKLGREKGRVSSRLGFSAPAARTRPDHNFYGFAEGVINRREVSHFVCDESQFFTTEQIDQLAAVVDVFDVNVYAFGLMTTFQGELFDGSKRLVELSNQILGIDTCNLCSCGEAANMNARFVDGVQVKEGEINVVGDLFPGHVSYAAVCRKCWLG